MRNPHEHVTPGNPYNEGPGLSLPNSVLPKLSWPQSPFVLMTLCNSKTHFVKLSCGDFNSTPYTPNMAQFGHCSSLVHPLFETAFGPVSLLYSYWIHHHSSGPCHLTVRNSITAVPPPSNPSCCSGSPMFLEGRAHTLSTYTSTPQSWHSLCHLVSAYWPEELSDQFLWHSIFIVIYYPHLQIRTFCSKMLSCWLKVTKVISGWARI